MVKEQDFLKKKASYCLDLAKKLGATDSSVVVNNAISETVNFRNKKLDESNRSDDLGIDITIYIGKKKSSISSSNLLKDNINVLIEKCIETTKNTPEDEFNALPDKDLLAREIKELNLKYSETILITSAYHMKRSMMIAKNQDVEIIPYPINFTSNSKMPILNSYQAFNTAKNLVNFNTFFREILGIIAFKITS